MPPVSIRERMNPDETMVKSYRELVRLVRSVLAPVAGSPSAPSGAMGVAPSGSSFVKGGGPKLSRRRQELLSQGSGALIEVRFGLLIFQPHGMTDRARHPARET